jgi:hypothetical protein
MRVTEQERRPLDTAGLERLVAELRGSMARRRPGPVVCIDCYRDGGCWEHSKEEVP